MISMARQAAYSLGIRLTGTPGLFVDAKRAGLITRIESRSQEPGLRVVGRVQPTDEKPWHGVGCIHPTRGAPDPPGTVSEPVLDTLQVLGFRLARHTRAMVLRLAGEIPEPQNLGYSLRRRLNQKANAVRLGAIIYPSH